MIAVAPLAVALASAVTTLLADPRPRAQRAVAVAGTLAYAVAVGAVIVAVLPPFGEATTLVHRVGDWPAPFGIVLVADPLSAFVLAVTALVAVPAVAVAAVSVDPFGRRLAVLPLSQFLLVGVTGSVLTGDLFNLFVWFEVMLMASYVLVAFRGGAVHTRAALTYVALNLVGSAVMLVAIGGLYATTGTLNMADMAHRLANPTAYGVAVAPTVGLAGLLLAVFALKAGLVPFHFWVPDAYRVAPAPVTALLAGVVKNVGLYAVVRLGVTVFAAASLPVSAPLLAGASPLAYLGPALFALAAASVLFGGVAAAGADDLEGVLAHSSISQIGFVFLPVAVAATAPSVRALGIAAALVYALNHGLAKAALFLVAGTVEDAVGSTHFGDLGGLAGRAPLLAGGFLVAALSLVGLPPLVGFFGKLLVFATAARGVGAGAVGAGLALAVALAGAVLTIAYYTRAWTAVFWGEPTRTVDARLPRRWTPVPEGVPVTRLDGGRLPDGAAATLGVEVGAVLLLVGTVLALGVAADAVVAGAEAAARAALDTGAYVDAVAPVTAGGDG